MFRVDLEVLLKIMCIPVEWTVKDKVSLTKINLCRRRAVMYCLSQATFKFDFVAVESEREKWQPGKKGSLCRGTRRLKWFSPEPRQNDCSYLLLPCQLLIKLFCTHMHHLRLVLAAVALSCISDYTSVSHQCFLMCCWQPLVLHSSYSPQQFITKYVSLIWVC